jgi:hypothetical protein
MVAGLNGIQPWNIDYREMKNSAYLDIADPPHSGCRARRAGCSATNRADCRSNHFFHSSNHLRKESFDQRYGLANRLMGRWILLGSSSLDPKFALA